MPSHDENLRREQAFLSLLKYSEHGKTIPGDVYRTLYGGRLFSNMSTHPNTPVTKWGHTSTAAGAYQIEFPTYQGFVKRHLVHDFSPTSQDKIALSLIQSKGALPLIQNGDIASAIMHLRKTWASLPSGTQHALHLEEATR